MKKTIISFLSPALLVFLATLNFQFTTCFAQGTAFSYQGQLRNNGQAAGGIYDLRFTIYDSQASGNLLGGPITNSAVPVTNGLFTTTVDFGNVFAGGSNWLEIAVSTNQANAFTTLAPRQQLNPVPYAITAANVSGTVPLSALPSAVVTNGASGVNVSGTFSGNGSGITNVPGALAQVLTSSSSVLAQPNTAYYLTNSSSVSVSLPTNANVGDIVQVDGAGAGGWQVLGPQPWTESTSTIDPTDQTWRSVASSANGSNLVAVADPDDFGGNESGIWMSGDSGVTWTESTSIGTTNQQWSSVASSASGSNLVAVASEGGIWTSTDGGVTWTESTSTPLQWSSVASSASGSNLVAVANEGGIWTSTDDGVAWKESTSIGTTAPRWSSVASSVSGSNLAAVANGGGIWTSTDGGVAWTESTSSGTTAPRWRSVASSANGSNLVAAVIEGGIWTSTNSGVNWTESTSIGTTNKVWESVASSANGSNLVAVASEGGIWTSTNSGVNWTESTSSGTLSQGWHSVASSASGSNLVAVANGIWTSSEAFTGTLPEDFNGLAGSSQAFQYLGSGIWQPLTPSPGDNGQGLTNLDASGLTSGTVPLAQLPAAVVTNNEAGVTLSGTFSGNVATLSSGQTFTGSNTFQVVDSYGGVRITDGSTNSNVSIQPLASPNSGFQAINFNGYYDNGEHQYNSSKARWRIFVDQRGPADSFNIDSYLPASGLDTAMTITTNGNVGIGMSAPIYPLQMASGAYVTAAGVWTSVSDRNVKEDFTAIQPEDVLDHLVAMPITQWRYKVEPDGTRHIGPMAQDFYAAFGLGQNNKAIGSIDEDGVALAAIQGLNQKLHSVETQNAALKQQNDSLAKQLDELKAEVKALKQRQ